MLSSRSCYFCKGTPEHIDTRIVAAHVRVVCKPPCPQTRAHDKKKRSADDDKIDGFSVSDV